MISRQKNFRLSGKDIRNLGFLSLLLGAIFFIFHFYGVSDVGYFFQIANPSIFIWSYRRWVVDFHGTYFALNVFVPLISLLLVWMARRELARLPRRTTLAGLGLVLLSFVLHWVGLKSEQTRLSILSLIGLTWSIPLFICGWPIARRLLFPCFFLVFTIPLNFLDALVQPLRTLAAALSAGLLNGLGLLVSRSGPVITLQGMTGFNVDLADSYSSVFAYTACVAFALIVAYLANTRWTRKLMLVALGVPLLFFTNTIRSIMVLVIAAMFGNNAGTWVYHYASGPITLIFAFGGLAVLARHFHQKPEKQTPPVNTRGTDAGVRAWALPVSLALTLAAAWWIPAHVKVNHIEDAGINLDVPNSIGQWEGGIILFCHNPEGWHERVTFRMNPGDPCPGCGSPLQEMLPYEKQLLPPDTVIRKRQFDRDNGVKVFFSTVMSGKYRSSIHRPEVCLVGQGNQIARTFKHDVLLADGRKLKVKILEMVQHGKYPNGQSYTRATYYAYWFAGIGRETPSHIQRMIWMASDRLFKSESYRWAYLSVAGTRTADSLTYLNEVDDFIKQVYPFLVRQNTPGDSTPASSER